jgi:hypothetical protein
VAIFAHTHAHHIISTMATVAALLIATASGRMNEVWDRKTTEAHGIVWRGNDTVR